MNNYKIPTLPLSHKLESTKILKRLTVAHRALAELKGSTHIIPNQDILIKTLSLQEAKDSSAIENIITTHDELYQSNLTKQEFSSRSAKEVYNYVSALLTAYKRVKKYGVLTTANILDIQSTLVENSAGFRAVPGTDLRNEASGEVIYTPPQDGKTIINSMSNLEAYINNDELCDMDPLVKMAIIHHQFESIHPFYDGNGRTGRVINILYLVKLGLLETPILYLSRYINDQKQDYYQYLQAVRTDHSAWNEWILFILDGITKTATETTKIIKQIKELMLQHKSLIREKLPKIYSQDLLNIIFSHPYTKTRFLEEKLNISRITAKKYLDELCLLEIMNKIKSGRETYYVNKQLFELLSKIGQ